MILESFAADIPASLRYADDVLTRYGRWATSGGRGSRPATLDRMYIREADRKESLEAYMRRRSHVPADPLMPTNEALAAQRALARVADRERIVLSVLYVPRSAPIEVQLRRLRIPPRLSRERHLAGLRMFGNLYRILTAATDRYNAPT